jgi:integral membrane sensor domain MASE1
MNYKKENRNWKHKSIILTHVFYTQNLHTYSTIYLYINLSFYYTPVYILQVQVVRTKSVEYMPLSLSLCLTVNAALWSPFCLYKDTYQDNNSLLIKLFFFISAPQYNWIHTGDIPNVPMPILFEGRWLSCWCWGVPESFNHRHIW